MFARLAEASLSLDIGTLFVIAICVTSLLGLFLLFAWMQDRISALACQAEVKLADEVDFRTDIDNLLDLVDGRTKIVYVSNPANPTGTWNTPEEIADLRARLDPSILLPRGEAVPKVGFDSRGRLVSILCGLRE